MILVTAQTGSRHETLQRPPKDPGGKLCFLDTDSSSIKTPSICKPIFGASTVSYIGMSSLATLRGVGGRPISQLFGHKRVGLHEIDTAPA
jgi:hypothetical protein